MRRVIPILNRLTWSPEERALELSEVKKQRRVSSSASTLDSLFLLWIDAATSLFEEQTGRQLISAPWELWLDSFPPVDRFIEIPKAPLLSVTSVEYFDGTDWQVMSADDYTVVAPAGDYAAPGRVALVAGASWPVPELVERSVRITFVAGYGETSSDLPALAQAALMLLVGHYHRTGEDVQEGNFSQVPMGATSILDRFKYTAIGVQRPWTVSWLD
jgi:uncharacterized phiE125 gp8 family phage protein